MVRLNPEYEIALRESKEAGKKATNFLIASFRETGERKLLAQAMYQKYIKVETEWENKIQQLISQNKVIWHS